MANKKVVRYTLVKHKWPDEIEAERKRKRKIAGIVAICVLCFFGGFGINAIYHAGSIANDATFSRLSEVYSIMSNKFYFGKDMEDFNSTLIDGAINGMVSAGEDIHTMYMDANLSETFTSSMEGSFVGIGVQYYEQTKDVFVITRVYKNSPAQEAGLMKGDQIYSINGTICENMDADKVKSLITGDSGSTVEIELVREGEHIKKTVERREIQDTVYSEINGETATLELTTFAETSGEEVGKHLKDIKEQGCKNLILDLRDNTGGYLTAAQQISSYLLKDEQVIFKEEDKDGNVKDYMTRSDLPHYEFNKIIVLVNGETASAAEVLTAALKETVDATVVGVKTYGKGTVQMPLAFNDGSMLKYTIAEWLTPSGEKINEKGIEPDVEVTLDPALTTGVPQLGEDETYAGDTVNIAAKSVQIYLKFLGYNVDRSDEYFSPTSSLALKQYQSDKGIDATGSINADTINSLLSSVSLKYHEDQDNLDVQMKKAVELANGNGN